MIINSTSEIIQVFLSGSVTTRNIDYFSSYNIISSTGLTPSNIFGDISGPTVSTLLPTPNSNEQNQLRHCVIYNNDTSGNTAVVQYSGSSGTRILFSSYLFVGDSIQYTINDGWQVYNHNGIIKNYGTTLNPSSVRMPEYFNAVNATTTRTLTSGTNFAYYLGSCDRPYTQITILYQITTALGATITYGELAIYKGYPSIGSSTLTLTRCGFKTCTGATQDSFGSTGVKTTPILVTGLTIGDDIYAVFGTVTNGTNAVIRAGVVDNLGSGFILTNTGSNRPSTNQTLTFTTQTAQEIGFLAWQGFQW